jgi:hypothetical protein
VLGLTDDEFDHSERARHGPPGSPPAPTTPAGTPGRAELGIPARPVRRDHRADPCADRRGQRARRAPGDLASAAIYDARIHVLDGHAHFAHKTDPDMVAEIVEKIIT